MSDEIQRAIYQAFLNEHVHWLDEVERAETPTSRTIAVIIADAMHIAAQVHRPVGKSTND